MVAENDRTANQYALTVEVAPAEVDAGAEVALVCRVTLPPRSDPSDIAVSIRDNDNAELAFANLSKPDGEVYFTDEILLRAPPTEGEHIYRAVLVAGGDASTSIELISAEASFVVKAHAMRLNVWDLPTAIAAGEGFTLKVGVKCSAGCNLAGRELSIFDGDGNLFGTGKLLDEVWPRTSALYFAEVEGKAPPTVGSHRWQVRLPASASLVPHSAGLLDFDIKVVDPPDCDVTIEALDAETQAPIEGARVVMHPYRAVTGAEGVAILKVVRGDYKLLVSATKYLATARTVEVAESTTIRADLTLEPVIDPASYYV